MANTVFAKKSVIAHVNGMKVTTNFTKEKYALYVTVNYEEDGEYTHSINAFIDDKDGGTFDFCDYRDDGIKYIRIASGNYRKVELNTEELKKYGVSVIKTDKATVINVEGIIEMGFTPDGEYLTAKTSTADSITYSAVFNYTDKGTMFNVSNVNCELEVVVTPTNESTFTWELIELDEVYNCEGEDGHEFTMHFNTYQLFDGEEPYTYDGGAENWKIADFWVDCDECGEYADELERMMMDDPRMNELFNEVPTRDAIYYMLDTMFEEYVPEIDA